MIFKTNNNKPVTPERAIQILAAHNVKVTIKQAEQILEFMNKFAQIAMDTYVNDVSNTANND